jgi:high-affinity Fe2+/Pb2+ permease
MKKTLTTKTDRIFSYLKLAARILLIISAMLLLLSIIFLFVYQEGCYYVHSNIAFIMWTAVIMSFYSGFYSILIIAASLIYHINKKQRIWPIVKKEILLLMLTGILMTVFYFVNDYYIGNYH